MADILINRQTIISFPDEQDTPDITSGIVEGSLVVSEILLTQGLQFGAVNSNRFEVDLQYVDDLTGRKIYVYQTDNNVITPIFTGYVQSCKQDDHEIYRKVVAYDLFYYLGSRDVAYWWTNFWEGHENSTVTLGEALRDFLTTYAVTYVDKELLNDSMEITNTQDFPTIRFDAMLQLLCEANLCNPNVNRQGQVEFITVYDSTERSVEDAYEWDNTDFEDYVTQPIDLVRIQVKGGVVGALIGEGSNCLNIKNNPFFYDKDEIELGVIAQTIYNAVSELSYKPASIKMILSDFSIKLGDMVRSSKGISLVCALDFSGSMLIEETITSVGEEAQPETEAYSSAEANAWEAQRALENFEGNQIQYVRFANPQRLILPESETLPIIEMLIRTTGAGVVLFHAEIHIQTEASQLEFYLYYDETQLTWYPKQVIFQDGEHIISLFYPLVFDENRKDAMLEVYCKSIEGDSIIPVDYIRAVAWGQNIAKPEEFTGTIRVSDTVNRLVLDDMVQRVVTDSADVNVQVPTSIEPSATISRLALGELSIRNNMHDGIAFNKDFLNRYTHSEIHDGLTERALAGGDTHEFLAEWYIHS